MANKLYHWSKSTLREHLSVMRGETAPSIILKDATYLNSARKSWSSGHIWIYDDRIMYAGPEWPEKTEGSEIVDCSEKWVVPGYIEPHAHPFQLYSPQTLAEYASVRGTTTLVNDNLFLFLNMEKYQALSAIEDLGELPTSMFWWARYDSQTELEEEDRWFSPSNMKDWLEHPLVVQGGELTSWPKVMTGNDTILHWMQYTKELNKPIEGHLPGSSVSTITQMALLGVDGEHEAMTAEEALRRLDAGLVTSLRYSSIRPDLPDMIEGLLEAGITDFRRFTLNTDGSTPAFYKEGVIDRTIQICLDKGVPEIDAYEMGSYNAAVHLGLDNLIGMIAPGRLAHLNILSDKREPKPEAVLAKGQWVYRDETNLYPKKPFEWEKYGVTPLEINWELKDSDFHFSMPMGIELMNSVILKPYHIGIEANNDELWKTHDESFFMVVDRYGNWRVNTILKGFATKVDGFASSFNNNGDIIMIGKHKEDMEKAAHELIKNNGGIFLVEDGEVVEHITLDIFGLMSSKPMEEVISEHEKMVAALKNRGYPHEDPIYSLLFFAATHLPYIRVTQKGIYDVHKKMVLFPAIMR